MSDEPMRGKPAGADRAGRDSAGTDPASSEPAGARPAGREPVGDVRTAEWAVLGEWLGSPPAWPQVDLGVLRDCLGFVGRARASLAALEAELVAEAQRRRATPLLRRSCGVGPERSGAAPARP